MSKSGGFIIYNGPSAIDGAPILVVAINSKRNRKTGHMIQTYIMRSDISPLDASKTGKDYSICGNCPLRGNATTDANAKQAKDRGCYVLLGQGPTGVWKGLQRGIYSVATGHKAIAAIGQGALVRLGTYGDPAAVPSYIWDSLLSESDGHTAYSHQSEIQGSSFDPSRMMKSADSLAMAQGAWAKGWRTFRVVTSVSDIVRGKEILCPASEEAGKRTTCNDCKLCGGASVRAKSIAIPAHGTAYIAKNARIALAA